MESSQTLKEWKPILGKYEPLKVLALGLMVKSSRLEIKKQIKLWLLKE